MLDNGLVKACIEDGIVVSLRGGDGREAVPDGVGIGRLFVAQDFPNAWDVWDIDRAYRATLSPLVSSQVEKVWSDVEGQHLRTSVLFNQSRMVTTWSLAPDAKALTMRIDVDWHETKKLLKCSIPVDVHTDHAQHETQFGHLVRTTHENTSWDAYRFEVCAHRWLRVADAKWGACVANESTYGWDVIRHESLAGGTWSEIRATLLKAPRYPDPHTDQGTHTFTFTIRPMLALRILLRKHTG